MVGICVNAEGPLGIEGSSTLSRSVPRTPPLTDYGTKPPTGKCLTAVGARSTVRPNVVRDCRRSFDIIEFKWDGPVGTGRRTHSAPRSSTSSSSPAVRARAGAISFLSTSSPVWPDRLSSPSCTTSSPCRASSSSPSARRSRTPTPELSRPPTREEASPATLNTKPCA
jgi:hypothetical protein